MRSRKNDLPADADANKKKEDIQNKVQEEYDDKSKVRLEEKAIEQQEARNQQEEDSQMRHEQKLQTEKKKQTEKWDKVERKLPYVKK